MDTREMSAMRKARTWLVPFICIWFSIGVFSYLRRLPAAFRELSLFGLLEDPLTKRDALYPRWSECVRALTKSVPKDADFLLLSDTDDMTWGLLTLQLKYETYPHYRFYAAYYRDILPLRPSYLLIYRRPPASTELTSYREIYRDGDIAVLRRR